MRLSQRLKIHEMALFKSPAVTDREKINRKNELAAIRVLIEKVETMEGDRNG